MPQELRPAVMYVAHNAHYDACFAIPTPSRKHQVCRNSSCPPYLLMSRNPKNWPHFGAMTISVCLQPKVLHHSCSVATANHKMRTLCAYSSTHALLQVYKLLNLTPDASSYIEHNGSVDILRPAVVHMRKHQHGHGVVAVSPRYGDTLWLRLSAITSPMIYTLCLRQGYRLASSCFQLSWIERWTGSYAMCRY
jgi:hypothetical protein